MIGAPNDEHGPHRRSLKGPYPFTFVVPTFVNPFMNTQTPHAAASLCRSHRRPCVRARNVAFSWPSATLEGPPCKRPMSLDMSVVRSTVDPASPPCGHTAGLGIVDIIGLTVRL